MNTVISFFFAVLQCSIMLALAFVMERALDLELRYSMITDSYENCDF